MTRAVFFDVDFTLIYPGPTFRGEGYHAFCTRHGMDVDPARFADAVASAASLLDGPDDAPYAPDIFIAYTRHIIEQMGGRGPGLDACAREIYEEWAACQHFELYDDVPDVLRSLTSAGNHRALHCSTPPGSVRTSGSCRASTPHDRERSRVAAGSRRSTSPKR